MSINFNKFAVARLNPALANGIKKSSISFRIMKRLTRCIDG